MNANAIPSLPYTSFDAFLAHPPAHGTAYILRHAERTPLTEPETIFSADLTEQGWEDARRFGRRLGEVFTISAVFCSPIDRCIHTATAILAGAGVTLRLQMRWWLFSPFLKVHEQHNRPGVSIHSNSMPERGIDCLDKKSLQTLVDRLKIPLGPGSINLYITHDSTVTPLLGYLLGRDTVWVSQYPGYLEGFVMMRDGTGKPALFNP